MRSYCGGGEALFPLVILPQATLRKALLERGLFQLEGKNAALFPWVKRLSKTSGLALRRCDRIAQRIEKNPGSAPGQYLEAGAPQRLETVGVCVSRGAGPWDSERGRQSRAGTERRAPGCPPRAWNCFRARTDREAVVLRIRASTTGTRASHDASAPRPPGRRPSLTPSPCCAKGSD